ncbi:MAG: hypothetical protein U0T81_10365 [Saprospiraceae bacterium]
MGFSADYKGKFDPPHDFRYPFMTDLNMITSLLSGRESGRIEFICCQLQQVSMIDLMERAGQAFTDWFICSLLTTNMRCIFFVAMAITVATDSLLDAASSNSGYSVRIYAEITHSQFNP